MMKTNRMMIFCLALFASVVHLNADEVELDASDWTSGFWASATVDFNSKYMWRGIIMNDRPVWQPAAYFGYENEAWGGIYAGVWSSLDLTHRRNVFGGNSRRKGSMQEFDYYLAYTKAVGPVSLEIGNWWYTYPNDNFHTYNDLFFSMTYNNEIVVPGGEIWWSYRDQVQMDACFWFNFFLKRDFLFFDDKLVVTPKIGLAFGDAEHTRNYIVDYRRRGADGNGVQLTDQTSELRIAYKITQNVSVGAHINYTWLPSATLRGERWMTSGHDSRSQVLWGGASLSYNF